MCTLHILYNVLCPLPFVLVYFFLFFFFFCLLFIHVDSAETQRFKKAHHFPSPLLFNLQGDKRLCKEIFIT